VGDKIGYARVSTVDQDPRLQLDALAAAGCLKTYVDKATGTKADRPQWIACLADLRSQGTETHYIEGNRDYRIGVRHEGKAFDVVSDGILREDWGFPDSPASTKAGDGVTGLKLVDGKLTGTSTTDFPIIYVSRPKTVDVTLKDVVFDAVDGNFPHPNTMTVKLMAGNTVLLEQEYYSVGGGFIEWKGYKPPKKNAPKYPFATMKELRQHAEQNTLSIADVVLANEMSIPGRTQDEVYAFIDKITGAMVAIVKSGLDAPDGVLPGPIKLQSKAATVYKRAMDDKFEADRGIGCLSAYALAGSEENGRGHLVVTAPTGGSAGVLPALVYGLGEGGRKLSQDQIRKGMLAAAAIGYLCKHNATLSAAEGGCQAEIGVASAMAAALIAAAYDASPRVIENAAESALEHHLGMTCDPVAGYVQVPCIERCAFGAVKAWTAWAIASNEIESRHRIDLDATITAMAQTAKDMNSKYKETSQAGLALSVTLC
jgi:L-serine dehydratase